MSRLLANTVASGTFLLGVACTSVDRPADWYTRMPTPPGAFRAPGPFDAIVIDGTWGVGDQVVYAIDVEDAGVHHAFTFTLKTTKLPLARPDSAMMAHPVHGRVLTHSANDHWQYQPVAYWGEGKGELRAELRGDDGSACGGEFQADLLAHWFVDDMAIGIHEGVHSLFAALLSLDCMHATLMRVIRTPGPLSVLAHFGRVEIGLEWQEVERLQYRGEETPLGVLPTTWLPITITANGQPALDGRVQFTWKRPPLLLSAGILQVEAWHPDDATRRVTVRLASARRGTPPDAPDPTDLCRGLCVGMTTSEVLALCGGGRKIMRTQGRLADGRRVALVEFDVPNQWLFGVLHEDRLLYASLGPDLAQDYLRRRGFVDEAAPPPNGDR